MGTCELTVLDKLCRFQLLSQSAGQFINQSGVPTTEGRNDAVLLLLEVNYYCYNIFIAVIILLNNNGGRGGGSRSEIEAAGQDQSSWCVQADRWSFSLLKRLISDRLAPPPNPNPGPASVFPAACCWFCLRTCEIHLTCCQDDRRTGTNAPVAES